MQHRLRFLVLAAFTALFISTMVPTALAAGLTYVEIAVAGPVYSEGAAWLGSGMWNGVELAVADYRSQLASAGLEVEVQVKDDKGDPAEAVVVANEIVALPYVLGVVGHLNSGCSIPASTIYANDDLAMITPISTNPYLTQQGLDNVFRTCATDAGSGRIRRRHGRYEICARRRPTWSMTPCHTGRRWHRASASGSRPTAARCSGRPRRLDRRHGLLGAGQEDQGQEPVGRVLRRNLQRRRAACPAAEGQGCDSHVCGRRRPVRS